MNRPTASAHLAVSDEQRSATETHLHGYRLVLVRLMCLTLCVLSVGLFVASIPSFFANAHMLCTTAACNIFWLNKPVIVRPIQALGLSIDFFATYLIVIASIFSLGYWLVAALLFWRKSDNRLALLTAVFLGTFPILFNDGFINTLSSSWWFLAHFISFLGALCISLFFCVFPGGHFVPRWTRWVFVVALMYWGFDEFFPSASFNPFSRSQALNDLIFLGLIASIVVIQIYRYRRVSSPAERQQTKWVVYGVSMGWGGYLVLFTISLFLPAHFQTSLLVYLIASTVCYGLLLLVPFSIGFAILRSRLWDIDLIINRTLVYGTLTGILALIYFGCVVLLQHLVNGVTGQVGQSPLVIVGSTLAIFALFQPLRRRIQRIIDRRFYRRKYDAAKTLEAFSATLHNKVDLNQLREQLIAVVEETMQPAHVSLWLRPPEQSRQRNTQLLPTIDEEERVPS